ncbi:MAG: carbonic anhydrase [Phenylobacterium sp.]|uniref:carbonic anhydrase n=1 Tax=Phenylobacterium sp. TaxID=1871053 RepID=UPI001A5B64FA|nr:carbonic anhydrase [Phenylobacterium sp.]MBL8771344.1 carbonic anhydrase [Phenylobacterium sp.]
MTNLLSRRRALMFAAPALFALPALAEEAVHAAKPRPKAKPKGKAAPAAPAAEAHPPAAAAHHAAPSVPPEEALERLMSGNARYVAGQSSHPNSSLARRAQVAAAQAPFAVILACADSRVAPELIFDQGLGDLFTVRVAGNVVDDAVLASIEYSVIHLGSTLVMVLGHERCGAVRATADALAGKGDPADQGTRIAALAGLIAPAVRTVPPGAVDTVDAAISLNAARTAQEIFAQSAPLRARVLAGQLKIVAARYDLDDGRVSPARGGPTA